MMTARNNGHQNSGIAPLASDFARSSTSARNNGHQNSGIAHLASDFARGATYARKNGHYKIMCVLSV